MAVRITRIATCGLMIAGLATTVAWRALSDSSLSAGRIAPGQAVSVAIVDGRSVSSSGSGGDDTDGDRSAPDFQDTMDFTRLSPAQQEALIRRLIAAGRLDMAMALIELAMESQTSDVADVRLAAARLLADEGFHQEAIAQYRDLLRTEPDRVDARLELGQQLFLVDDFDGASFHFDRARAAGDLSADATAVIDTYMEQMRRRRPWSLRLSMGLAPDTNINQGTTMREVDIFGLPLKLSDSMRQTTGIGIFADISGEYALDLPVTFDGISATELRMGGGFTHTAYSDPDDGRSIGRVHFGPRFRHESGSTSLLAVGSGQWYGIPDGAGRLAVGDAGVRLELERTLGPRTRFDGNLDVRYRMFPDLPARDGLRVLADASMTHGLDARSFARGRVRFDRTSSGLPVNAYSALTLEGGYYRDLNGPFSIYLRGAGTHRLYDERPFFATEERVDQRLEASIDVTYQNPLIFGFAPTLRYGYTLNMSTVDVYDFDRHRLDVGLTRAF